MGQILTPAQRLHLPNGVAEQREQERINKLLPLALESEKKANDDFAIFLETHNVLFRTYQDFRKEGGEEIPINEGLRFISRLRLPEENNPIQ